MNRTFDQFKKWWDERSFGQKFGVLFLIIALIAILTYMFALASQPDWQPLFDELSPTDAKAVGEQLKKSGVIYKISADGTKIMVPKTVLEEARINIATADVIDSEDGTSKLKKIPQFLTPEQQKLWIQSVLQGEIVKLVKKINGIKTANVTIAQPESSVFATGEEKPSAAVMLVLDPGIKLGQQQIKAIKNLVAYSVPELNPERVTVSDQAGNLLSEDITGEGSATTIDDLRSKFEKNIQKKVLDVLKPLAGDGDLAVSVNADMNFDRVESVVERVIPTTESDGQSRGVLVSEQSQGEKYTGQSGNAPGGVPGTQTNITNPSYAAPGGADGAKSSNYDKTNTTLNYDVSKEKKNITYAPGKVERLTVAVSLNKLLTTAQKEKIETLVKVAAGIDDARGDLISIADMPFANADEAEEMQKKLAQENTIITYANLAKEFLPYLLILVFGGVTLAIFWSFLKNPVEAEEYIEHEEPVFEFPETPDLLEAASIPVIEAKLDPEIERMRSEINSFVMNDPAEAARLLLTYIKE